VKQTPTIAVYTGSFDPITLGHLNVIERSSRLVSRLVVGVGTNLEKLPLFSLAERVALVQRVTARFDNVEVKPFDGLAVDFVKQSGARVMIRGVRPLTDIAAEFTMTMANRELDPSIETLFLMADGDYAHVSSSLIKQIAPLADDDKLARFVPREVIGDLRRKLTEALGPQISQLKSQILD
jgi:pantetheine-phosphate adenylyltransferase